MLPEIGTSEILVIAIVALIVVGPKDLPLLLRKIGQFMARLRGMAAEFRASFDEMARQSELDELRREVAAMRSGQFAADAAGVQPANQAFEDINRSLADVGVQLEPTIPYQFAQLEEAPVADAHGSARPRKARAKATPAAPSPKRAVRPKSATSKASTAKPATKPRVRKPKDPPS